MFPQFRNACRRNVTLNVENVGCLQKCWFTMPVLGERIPVPEVEPPKKAKKDKTPIIVCKRSEFNFYEGDTYPKFKPIELASRAWYHRKSKGDHFTIYPIKNIEGITNVTPSSNVTFKDFNLNWNLLKNLRDQYDIECPVEIQERAIPMILSGENVIIAAHTGCGKTLAYLLPLLHQILKWKDITDRHFNSPLGLIITPSKELAAQIAKVVIALTQDIDFNVKTIVGGQTKHLLMSKPIENVDLIIASLGTINKLVRDGLYKMDHVRITVLDEADSLFDGTFQAKLRQVLRNITFGFKQEHLHNTLPVTAQLMLVSATMPTDLIETLHDIVNTDSLQTASTNRLHHVHVLQKFIRLMKPDKPTMLLKMVKQKYLNDCPLIIFSNETSTCDWISMYLNEFNIRNVNLNGQMNLKLRRGMFSQFQCGNVTVLSTTDAGSRGLDTVMARQVLNYDLPTSTVDYIHRCGRIGRLGSPHDCKVTSFVARPLEIVLVQKIERAIRKKVPIPLCDVLKDANESDKIDSKYDQELQDMLDNIPDPKTSQYSEEYPTPY